MKFHSESQKGLKNVCEVIKAYVSLYNANVVNYLEYLQIFGCMPLSFLLFLTYSEMLSPNHFREEILYFLLPLILHSYYS